MKNSIFKISFSISLVLAIAPDAFAYLDPGTGSMILQILVAGVLGAVFTLKTYWAKITGVIKKVKLRSE